MNALDLRFRSTRRCAVVTHYTSLGIITALVFRHIYTAPVMWSILVLLSFYLLTMIGLSTITRPYGVGGNRWKAGPNLDERQRHVRAEALGYSYWLTSSILAFDYLWSTRFSINLNILFVGLMASCMFPAAIIAWTEPDFSSNIVGEAKISLHFLCKHWSLKRCQRLDCISALSECVMSNVRKSRRHSHRSRRAPLR